MALAIDVIRNIARNRFIYVYLEREYACVCIVNKYKQEMREENISIGENVRVYSYKVILELFIQKGKKLYFYFWSCDAFICMYVYIFIYVCRYFAMYIPTHVYLLLGDFLIVMITRGHVFIVYIFIFMYICAFVSFILSQCSTYTVAHFYHHNFIPLIIMLLKPLQKNASGTDMQIYAHANIYVHT